MIGSIIFATVVFVGAVVFALSLISRYIYVCRPSEVLIFSGRRQMRADGSQVGYRVVTGGWAFRWPFIETVSRMDMTIIPVDVEVRNAYSRGGIPLVVQAIANVKISNDRRYLGNAIERFLDRDPGEIHRVAKETLEGQLRGIVSSMTPEEVNEDRLKFANRVAAEAVPDLAKLGLQLDTIKIQAVNDEQGYLKAIGREQIAIIRKEAEVAESNAQKEAEESEAAADARAQVARTQADTQITERRNLLDKRKAELDANVRAEEQKASLEAQAARAEAEVELQKLRVEVEGLRLQTDKVIPAEMEKRARELIEAGNAATIAAEGEAVTAALGELMRVWEEAGVHARDIFLLQRSDVLMRHVADAVKRVRIEHVSLVDGGNGDALGGFVANYPAMIADVLQEVARSTGIDLLSALRSTVPTGRPAATSPAPTDPAPAA